jgi:tetratricopeptide (TPR) repeat protein
MNKENFLFAVIGLLAGVIIGFTVANSLNRSAVETNVSTTTAMPTANPNLPPDHPPFVPSGDQTQTQNAPLPQVTEAIEKAKQNPQDFEAQMTAADLYYQIQRFEDAAKFYEQANKLRPDETETLVKLGNSYFDAEKFEQAEKWYEKALQKNPKDINVRNDYSLTFFLRSPRDTDRAIKEYNMSLNIDPNHEQTLQNLAIAYKEKSDMENLRKTLDVLKKVNPNNPAVTNFSENAANPQAN